MTLTLRPLLKKMTPALGPLRVLCTVVVTISQWGKGDGTRPAATRPLPSYWEVAAQNEIQRTSYRNIFHFMYGTVWLNPSNTR
jgi:hypothetical protein